MIGVILTSFVKMLEEEFSSDFAHDVIEKAQLTQHVPFSVKGYYSYNDLAAILWVLSEKTGRVANDWLAEFGEYLFSVWADNHTEVFANTTSVLDVLEKLEDIHVHVQNLYASADLPSFLVQQRSEKIIAVQYFSTRDLRALAQGLIQGAANYFNESIELAVQPANISNVYLIEVKCK